MENLKRSNYKNENIETKYLNNMQKIWFLKVKNSFLELEKDFKELKNKELKIKKEMEELFFKQTNVSIDYIFDRFEEKETKKERPIKNS